MRWFSNLPFRTCNEYISLPSCLILAFLIKKWVMFTLDSKMFKTETSQQGWRRDINPYSPNVKYTHVSSDKFVIIPILTLCEKLLLKRHPVLHFSKRKKKMWKKKRGYGWQMFQRISFYLFWNNKFEEKGVGGLKLFKDNGEQVKTCKKVGTRLCSFMKGLYPHKPFWRHFNLEVPFFSEKAQWVFRNT